MKPFMGAGAATRGAAVTFDQLKDFVNHLKAKKATEYKEEFTPGFFHGSPSRDIEEFAPGPRGATFVTQDPKFAESFLPGGKSKEPFGPGSTMYPLSIRKGKHFDPEDPASAEFIQRYIDQYNANILPGQGRITPRNFSGRNTWLSMENPKFMEALKGAGYDTFAVTEGGVKNVGVFDPKNIRGRFAEFNPEMRESKDFMKAEGGLARLAKGSAVRKAAGLILPPAENAARTQIIGTLPTYEKAGQMLQSRGGAGRGLDFGAGLGEGAKRLPGNWETYEPFARGWKPTYSQMSEIPEEAYGQLTNLNVLNVVPREVRDEIVQGIGRSIEPGGLGVITTRGADVMKATGRPGPEPMSIITSRDTYQKGFTNPELQEYLRYMLGDKFNVEPARLGPAGAMIRKKAEGGLAYMAKGGKTPAWQRKEGQNPEGGLNAKGRASYKAETGGTLKRPQPEGGPRRDSFCARMKGMKKKLTSAKTANDPDSRINKSLRAWNC